MTERFGVVVRTGSGPGVLHQLTGVIARQRGDISSVEIFGHRADESSVYFEIELPDDPGPVLEELRALPIVRDLYRVATLQMIYGKRVIIMGGGAQVGQVAIGAISEADRHNIRGERISVDTIPLVGEQALADAVRAVARLPRASALVLAGSLMGGDIETAVREVRAQGLLVVSLNMAGSVPEAVDLVVTDPVQGGRDDRYGDCRHRQIHGRPASATGVLSERMHWLPTWRCVQPWITVDRGRQGRPTVRVKGRTHPQGFVDG
jgi:energy-converting hydrogenase B subunit Q